MGGGIGQKVISCHVGKKKKKNKLLLYSPITSPFFKFRQGWWELPLYLFFDLIFFFFFFRT